MINQPPNTRTLPQISTATSLMKYVYMLWQWAWLIILAGVLAGGAAYITSIRTTPIYQTTTRLLVNDPPGMRSVDYASVVASQTITQTYSKMLTDTPVMDKVIEKLKLDTTATALSGTISVELIQGTQILSVSVTNTNPTQAVEIANTIGQVFADRIRELQSERYSITRESLQKQVTDMEGQISDTTAKLAQVNDPAQKLQLESRMTEYRKLYSSLVTQYEQVHLAEAQNSTSVAQIQPAQLPSAPIQPKTSQNTILAVVVGMLLAIGVVFAIDALDDTIRNPDEIRQKFNLPILGMIARHPITEGKSISQDQPRSPVAESFRALRTNIMYSAVDAPLRRVLITSSVPQDGKTTVVANLGVVMANKEHKVTIIDADMRRPQLHRRFGLPNRSGLSFLFVSPLEEIGEAIQSTDTPGLTIVTSGVLPPNPVELLTSRKMIQILDRLNQDSDLILIDTPSLLSVTDAAALAPLIDGVVLLVKPGETRRGEFRQAVEQLQAVRARILGVVLNNVDPKSRRYGYYYKRYRSKYLNYYEAKKS